jgi:hypothetical protein
VIACLEGDAPTAHRVLAEARGLERADWPPRLKELMCSWASNVCSLTGDVTGWERALRLSLALAEQGGLDKSQAISQVELAEIALAQADGPRAVEMGRRALVNSHRLGLTALWGYAAACLCSAHVLTGDLRAASESARAAQPVLGSVEMEAALCIHVALWCARSARMADAARLIGCAQAWRVASGSALEGAEAVLLAIIEAEFKATLGSAEFERLREAGAAMEGDETHRWLCSILATPASAGN